MFKEVMNDLWLGRISSLSNEVGLYVVLLEVLLFMPNSSRQALHIWHVGRPPPDDVSRTIVGDI
jgi:hypothetical protein